MSLQEIILTDLDKTMYEYISMDDLLEVMQLIDKHSDKLPEGDYLDICNHLKRVYSKRSDPEFFFDYDTFDVPFIGPTRQIYDYFYDLYNNRALNLDIDFIGGQIDYLRKEYNTTDPLKRKTRNIKKLAIEHYCLANDLIPEDHTPEELGFNDEDVTSMAKNYIYIENEFRGKYRAAIERRLNSLEDAEDKLYEL